MGRQSHTRQNTPTTSPSVQDVRVAILHFAELAAARESRGIEVNSDDSSDDDQRVVAEVTELLVTHRQRQRRQQRDAVLGMMLRALSDEYTRFRDTEALTAQDLEQG